LLEQAACEDGRVEIDEKFVADNRERHDGTTDKAIKTIEAAPATDLRKKAEE